MDVDLETAAPKVVIDASIDWVKGTTGSEQKIKLSTTTGYYSATFPTVSGADIVITNAANTAFSFTENAGTGRIYLYQLPAGYRGNVYLKSSFKWRNLHTTETCIGMPDIENNIVQDNGGGFGGDQVKCHYYYQDNGNEENHYLHRILSPVSTFPRL